MPSFPASPPPRRPFEPPVAVFPFPVDDPEDDADEEDEVDEDEDDDEDEDKKEEPEWYVGPPVRETRPASGGTGPGHRWLTLDAAWRSLDFPSRRP